MKKIIKYLQLRFFTTFYFVSGTFDHKGERKWFRLCYSPLNGFVNEKEVKEIFEEETGYKSKYFVVTNFRKISAKEYLNF